MKKLTKKISTTLLPLISLMYAPAVQAQTMDWTGICVGGNMGAGGGIVVDASDVATIQGFQCLIGNVLMIFMTGLGLIGFVMFIVGSFSYMLSGGNAKGTETAKNTMTYSVIGLVVALSSFIILNLISAFTGVSSILNFRLRI